MCNGAGFDRSIAPLENGTPHRITIQAFADETMERMTDSIAVTINPESFRHGPATAAYDTTADMPFGSLDGDRVQFTLTIDATGVVPGVGSVDAELDRLRKIAYRSTDQMNRPNSLRLLRGKVAFDCVLTEFDLTYTLFDPSGTPLRAAIKLAFGEHHTAQDLARRESKRGADLTHLHLDADPNAARATSQRGDV